MMVKRITQHSQPRKQKMRVNVQSHKQPKLVSIESDQSHSLYHLALGGVCLLLYANSLTGEFVHDDLFAVVRNKDVSSGSIQDILSDDYWGRSIADPRSHKSYRPLTILTFRFNYLLFGQHPFSFHVVNVLLHTLVSLLFMDVCRDCVFTRDARSSFHVGLLFAAHPIHTEAVSGIVGRADVLACLFFLLSFSAYSRGIINTGRGPTQVQYSSLVSSTVFAALALLSKENGITVLAVNAGYDIACNVRHIRCSRSLTQGPARCLLKRLVFISISGLFLFLVRVWVMDGTLPQFLPEDNPASFSESVLTRFLTFSYLIFFNVWLLLCPATLSYDWQVGSIPLLEGLSDPRNIITLLTFLALTSLAIKTLHLLFQGDFCRPLCVGLLFLVVPFIPASNIFVTVGFVVAERILYIPSMGFCILVVNGASKISASLPNKPLYHRMHSYAAVFLVLILSARTVHRNTVWQSRKTLFRSGLLTLPDNAKVHYNWANYLSDTGNTQTAVQHYKETLRLYPDHASAHNNLATLLPDGPEKESHLKAALNIDASHVNAHVNLGVMYSKLGNPSLATQHLEQALLIEADNVKAISNLASILTDLGEFSGAAVYHGSAIRLLPGDPDILNNYGVLMMRTGQGEQARIHFEKALSIQPGHVTTMGNLGLLERQQGRIDLAESWYLRALSMERSLATLKGLGGFYFWKKDWAKAGETYRQLLEIAPNDMDGLFFLGQAFTNMDSLSEGEDVLASAVALYPDHLELRRSLANIKGLLKKYQEAVLHSGAAVMIASQTDFTKETLAMIHFEHGNHLKDMGDYDGALEAYTSSVSLDSELSGAFLNIGGVLHLQGSYEEAEKNYLRALSMDPGNTILQENLRKLSRLMKKKQRVAP